MPIVCVAIFLSLFGCDSLSSSALASRCDRLYEELNHELTNAISDFEDGVSADSVIERYSPRIEKIARNVPSLRKDLARGGEKHHWQWPDLIMAESVLNYEATINEGILGWNPNRLDEPAETLMEMAEAKKFLPEELDPLAGVERRSIRDLKWFCNRVVAANLPPVLTPEDGGLVLAFMRREMAAKSLEIMRAIETEEEMAAFTLYLASMGIVR